MLPFTSGCEDVVSSGTDLYTTWRKTDPETILVSHMVDVQKSCCTFPRGITKEAGHSFSGISHRKNVPSRLSMQERLSIYNLNPGPRRGRLGATEKRIAGRRHIITLQEAYEYIDQLLLQRHFHVTHYGGCAVLFNKKPIIPTLRSSPFTFIVPDGIYPFRSWKEVKDG